LSWLFTQSLLCRRAEKLSVGSASVAEGLCFPCPADHGSGQASRPTFNPSLRATGAISIFQSGEQRRNCTLHSPEVSNFPRASMCSDLRGDLPDLRCISQPPDPATGSGTAYAQVLVRLSVLATPGAGLDECSHSNLVPVCGSDLHQRAGMVGPATRYCWGSLPA